ncbi:MAG: DUF2786 domain-containing protein [Chlamydiales bacterium]|nr:DUF2786 domain-containing protein [Chlamydiales bacterium]
MLSQQILTEEMGLKVGRSRLYYQRGSYPLNFVVFDHPTRLGYFTSTHYEIGINKLFLVEKDEEIKNLLRHELAHYMTFLDYGEGVPSHGKEFRSVCERYGWSSRVSRAKVPIEKAVKNRRIAEKVRKLLSLAESHHKEEAQAATLKAQELLLKHNLSSHDVEEETVVKRIFKGKRCSAKLQAIAEILRTFFVYPVFNHGKNALYLEIIGERLNVEIADYVFHFLDHHLEALWMSRPSTLKGLAAKNAFFRGISKGFLSKEPPSSGLMRIERALMERVGTIYPHLSYRKSSYRYSSHAEKEGVRVGQTLKIREGIKKAFRPLISWNRLP